MAINLDKSGATGAAGNPGFSVPGAAPNGLNGQDANCNWIDDDCARIGQPGANGMNGGPGSEGVPGDDAASFLIISVVQFDFEVTVAARGGAGGKGGKGGDGQAGGKGGRGGNGNDCELGRHGGNGGKGGDAGPGGKGGRGGRGGKISVMMQKGVNPASMSFTVSGGKGGLPGDDGTPGAQGAPGDDGSTTGVFSTSSDCEDQGPQAQWGGQGIVPQNLGSGADGADGPAPEFTIVPGP